MEPKIFLRFVFTFFSFQSIAQSTYLKPLDDPDRVPLVGFTVQPYYLDSWKANFIGGGFGMGVDFHIRKYADINLILKVPYSEREFKKEEYTMRNQIGPAVTTEILLGLNFFHSYTVKDEKVTINSFGDGSYTYIQVPVKQRLSLCYRTGFGLQSSTYTGSNLPTYPLDSLGSVTSGSDKNYYTFFYMPLGISIKKVRHAILSVNGHKNRAYGDAFEFYFDALPLLKIKMSDHNDPYDTAMVTAVAPRYKSSVGWRVGFMFKPSGRAGLLWGLELGAKPGPGNGLGRKEEIHNYFLINLGIVITEKRKV
jgi:hypothetical protein